MKALTTLVLLIQTFICVASTNSIVDSNNVSQNTIEVTQKRNIIQLSEMADNWQIISKNGQMVREGTSTNLISLEGLPIGSYILKIKDFESKIIAVKKVYKF